MGRVIYSFGPDIILNQARKQVMKASGGHYPAPLKILDVSAHLVLVLDSSQF